MSDIIDLPVNAELAESLLSSVKFIDEKYYSHFLESLSINTGWENQREFISHIVEIGIPNNVCPSLYFDTTYYLRMNRDVVEAEVNPLLHFVMHGILEGRAPSLIVKKEMELIERNLEVDIEYYNSQFSEFRFSNARSILLHYICAGEASGKQISPETELLGVEKIISHRLNFLTDLGLLIHQKQQAIEILVIRSSNYFDEEWYLYHYTDVAAAGIDPIEHYVVCGEAEGRNPNENFDPRLYLRLSPDVRSMGLNAFAHYITHGRAEGRLAHQENDTNPRNKNRTILFIGHDAIRAGAQLVLLEVVRWYYQHTDRKIKVILLGQGELTREYAKYAEVYVSTNDIFESQDELEKFCTDAFDFVYFNTVVAGRILLALGLDIFQNMSIISHVHEMDAVLSTFKKELESLVKVTDAWITVSSDCTAALKKSVPNMDRIHEIQAFIQPNCDSLLEVGEFRAVARNALGLPRHSKVVIGAGTVYWRKGPDIFIEVASKLLSHFSEEQISFIWLGDGPDRISLEQEVAARGLTKNIQFLGHRNDAAELIAAADVFFLSSREDPFPLVCLEAAQYAIPIVCFSNATGMTEFVRDDAGICVEDIDVIEGTKAVLKLLENRSDREYFGINAFHRLHELNTSSRQVARIDVHLRKVFNLKPALSVIVPCFNHERYLYERLRTIAGQTIRDIEIILLDDCSTDGSQKLLSEFASRDQRATYSFNRKNSGSPFKQWKKGLKLATADVVWIAESDDSCDFDMVAALLPAFRDPMVNISHAQTVNIDDTGKVNAEPLRDYLHRANPLRYEQSFTCDGFEELNHGMSFMCTLVNASGALFRKSALVSSFTSMGDMRLCGDWYIYVNMLLQGKIHYNTSVKNYFRRHSSSVIHNCEGSEQYFKERFMVADLAVSQGYLSSRAFRRILSETRREWKRFQHKNENRDLASLFDIEKLKKYQVERYRKPIKIAFYVHGMLFSKGGIEHVASLIANGLANRGHKVIILCGKFNTSEPVYPVSENVEILDVFDQARIDNSIQLIRKTLIEREIDIFIPMLSEQLFEPILAGSLDTGVVTVASEHNNPWEIERRWWSRERRFQTFRNVDHIHLLLDRFRDSLPDDFETNIEVIPNGIVRSKTPVIRNGCSQKIISVGRLVEQKRFDLLIKAFHRVATECPYWHLEIYGEGMLRHDLQELINRLGMNKRISLMGVTDNIKEKYLLSDFLVLPSDFEGFGMVVVEAMDSALPVIAFANCDGPNEIIQNGHTGVLVSADLDPIDGLADAIQSWISDPLLVVKLGKNAQRAAKCYDIENIIDRWEEFLQRILL